MRFKGVVIGSDYKCTAGATFHGTLFQPFRLAILLIGLAALSAGAQASQPAPPGKPRIVTGSADTTPPAVTLTSPAGGSTVSGTITLAANAADNAGGSGVARVEFYFDGSVLVGSDTTSPYSLS